MSSFLYLVEVYICTQIYTKLQNQSTKFIIYVYLFGILILSGLRQLNLNKYRPTLDNLKFIGNN